MHLPSFSGAMHSNVTRNWYSSENRAGLFKKVTSRMLTIDIADQDQMQAVWPLV
jgi:hypothetical protein